MLKRVLFVALVALFAVGIAAAQQIKTDILGPHNVNGHGCASCHAPHSGAVGNAGTNAASGENYLWGRDFYTVTYTAFGGNTIPVTNTGAFAATDPRFHTAACMSCHDGNQTHVIGMNGTTAETVEGTTVPTYLNDGTESLKNDHPVDVPYTPGGFNWAGTVDPATGAFTWSTTDAPTVQFTANYGRPVRFYGGTVNGVVGAYIECSTCHNPHSVNYSKGTYLGVKNAVEPTNFFIRGWYNTDNPNSNSGAQFCRSCHYSKSNEYVNLNTIVTQ